MRISQFPPPLDSTLPLRAQWKGSGRLRHGQLRLRRQLNIDAVTRGKNQPKHPKARNFVTCGLFSGLSTFSDLETAISKLPTEKERGDALEIFAEAYLATKQLHEARALWPCDTLPAEVAQRLGLPPTDKGVDGIFETVQSGFVAYQVKFRSGRVPLTGDDLGNFFGLADRVRTRLVFTNSNDVSEIAKQREGFVAVRGYDLDQLEPQDFELIEAWLRGSPPPERKRLSPRLPDQMEAMDDILEALAKRDRATALMTCGTGKTLVALWVAERLAECVVPRLHRHGYPAPTARLHPSLGQRPR